MHHYARASVLVASVLLTALLTASCSDTDARLVATQPSGVDSSQVVVSAMTATAAAQPVSNPFCPSVAQFNFSLDVIVRVVGSSPVVITGIRSQFTDSSGRRAPQVTLPMLPVTLPAPGPTLQFGSVMETSSVRSFPVILGIGCGTGHRGTVVVIVETSDIHGRRVTEQVQVPVR